MDGYKSLVEEVALHCLGIIGDVSCKCSMWSNWWPAGQLQASALVHPAHKLLPLRRCGTAVWATTVHSSNLSSNVVPKCCCCWLEVCVFGAELVVTEGWMSKGFYPAPIVSVAVLHCWHCVQGLEALLCCVRERLAAAGEGEAGCNPWWER